MAGEVVAVQTEALASVAANLTRAANDLRGAQEQMQSTVATNTGRWLGSGSAAAEAWKQADVLIGQQISELEQYAHRFSSTTTAAQDGAAQTETRNTNLFA